MDFNVYDFKHLLISETLPIVLQFFAEKTDMEYVDQVLYILICILFIVGASLKTYSLWLDIKSKQKNK
ncbi:hypothetical protein ACFQ3J_20950 [Paenibacillus provencensis]|uniref:Uncharacterized protein n=1 Tax=Paenibacillus provencensis TaxID=441151 RepID=A0ABW3PXC3_9BACL|nr:Uncharacterised protein [Mycobacterium tuberculosis]